MRTTSSARGWTTNGGVEEGAVNGIVKIKALGDNVISATISMAAIKELGIEPGAEATAVIKATSVMIGK